MSDALRAIQIDGFRASIILSAFSFVYGVLHAAGPGHGKVIISTYLLSHESQLRRGIALSFAAAFNSRLHSSGHCLFCVLVDEADNGSDKRNC